ncbi:23S rRNA (adenine(2030)-N(6))-methyltransferase RlmJ [Luteimonas aquatica]|uniref:23S rRNA (adenine(2030)-N(6))-methyltransferase RlmJ n=1 Tax=Luteimonas aquatica TaxID=450364 RepID=UPI001F55FB46|nr:23S rRNA (adenine(2030)-N(6))-methyltransferase RlmJ [Luteimonas aquatica]
MNYRHAFHAGNHADVLKHVALLAILDALQEKEAGCFVLDTHAGRGRYALTGDESRKTGESGLGIARLAAGGAMPPAVARYLQAVAAHNPPGAWDVYPGSPLLAADALRAQDRLAACELEPGEAAALKALFAADPRVAVHARDGYDAIKALLPPRAGAVRYARGLVLIDPPYEAQDAEYPQVLQALQEILARWPQAVCAVWYPIKRRRSLLPFLRKAAALPARSALVAELLVRRDDSPLRLNGSGMLLLNPPWKLEERLAPALPALQRTLEEDPNAGAWRLEFLRAPG